MSTPAVPPEMGTALQALFLLGNVHGATLRASSEDELTAAVAAQVATGERLQSLVPAALALLSDDSIRRALEARYVKNFDYELLQYNQFLLIRDEHRMALEEIYEAFLDDLLDLLRSPLGAEEDGGIETLREAVVDHHVAVWQFARELIGEQFIVEDGSAVREGGPEGSPGGGTAGEGNPITPAFAPPNYEYDPEFQLALWGLTPESLRKELKEPVLDLGCGEQAFLVRYLRNAGLDAYGIDKFAAEDEFVTRGDWLDAPLQPKHWGTIISHMAFSNHFFHHHLRKDGHPERYARRFMEIMDALQPGGRFLYAPGLPFFEALLPKERVKVITHPIRVDLDAIGLVGMAGQRGVGGGSNGQGVPQDPSVGRRPAFYATEIRILGDG